MKKKFKICFLGHWDNNPKENLITKIISKVIDSPIVFDSNPRKADLVLLYNFLNKRQLISQKINKHLGLRGLLSYQRMIAVSHENLDHPNLSYYRNLIINSEIPRLTFWPKTIDIKGCRFPYWWNYLDWEEFDLPMKYYSRYGKKIEINRLLAPIIPNRGKSKICILTSHLNHPRNTQIKLDYKLEKEIYRKGDWQGSKYDLISRYKYNFAVENSCGYGYETEKLVEAWDAGSIPVGYVRNPLGDFNQALFENDLINSSFCLEKPLLLEKPNLQEVEDYILNSINKFSL